MKIYFETTHELPMARKATLFCELPDHYDYPSEAFLQAVEDIAQKQGFIVTESCE